MRHIKNLDQWYQVPNGKSSVVYEGTGERTVELEVNCVGPCAVYTDRLVGEPGKWKLAGERILLGVVEGLDAFRWRSKENFAAIFEPSGEVWVRRDQTRLAALADPESPSYVRLEKAGLFVDELGVALHRQAVLQRLSSSQVMGEERRRNADLESRLDQLSKLVDSLQKPALEPKPEPKPEAKPEPDKASA